MFTANRKIIKADGEVPDEVEEAVTQALFDLESSPQGDLKALLHNLHITKAQEIDVPGGQKAMVINVPFRLLKNFHRIQRRLVNELEKKFSGRQVVIVADRRILPRESRKSHKGGQQRPMSRTLTAVHEAILDDVVYPTEIVGKRMRVRLDGSRLFKVALDPREKANAENRLATFSAVYKKLCGKQIEFEFPVM